MPLFYPPPPPHKKKKKKFAKPFSSIRLGITVVLRELEDKGYAKFGGVDKVHYGRCENVEW